MSYVEVQDDYGDLIEVSGDETFGRLYIRVTQDEKTAEVAFNTDSSEVKNIVEALAPGESEASESIFDKHTPRASAITLNEALLRLAVLHDLEVQFRYAKGKGDVIELRHLKPTTIRGFGDDRRFVGLDPDRDAPRGYRLDRIKGRVELI